MKARTVAIILCIMLLIACTPTTTSSLEEVLPAVIPTDTQTALPQGRIITVTSAFDSGPGSLRQALEEAQDYDTITFDPAVFPPDAPATIAVSTDLPGTLVKHLTLDASNAGVIPDGSQVSGDWNPGLQIISSEVNTIKGLQFSHFPGSGIAQLVYQPLVVFSLKIYDFLTGNLI